MGEIQFCDIGQVSTREETPEGFLSVTADFARVGIQEYFAGELPRNELPESFRNDPRVRIRMLRPEGEVFNPSAMRSFASKPVTNGHPPKFVDKTNFRQVVVGTARHKVERNGDKLRVGLVLQDEKIIDEVKAGKDQLSAGYLSDVIWEAGKHPILGSYDAMQTNIRGNHIAVVDVARGGSELRINDSWPLATQSKKEKSSMATRKINGIAVEFSDQGAQAVDGLIAEKEKISGEAAALRAQLADSKKEQERLRGEFDALKSSQLTDAQIDAKVRSRLQVLDAARRLFPDVVTDGKSEIDIKRQAITFVDSAFNLEGKSAEYVDGVFETMSKNVPDQSTRSLKKATKDAPEFSDEQKDLAGDARREFAERNAKAWQFGGAA